MHKIDKSKLAVIHIIKKELKLSDKIYRHILERVAGVKSAKGLDERKFRKLMNFFVRSEYYRVNKYGLTIKQKLYIKYLARDLDWTEDHLNNFIHKYYHKKTVNRLTRKDAMKLIESLKHIREHQKAPKA